MTDLDLLQNQHLTWRASGHIVAVREMTNS